MKVLLKFLIHRANTLLLIPVLSSISINVSSQQESWNLASGMPVAASGFLENYIPENLINANSPLCWTVEGGGFQWFEIYLESPAIIEEFRLTIGHNYTGEPIDIFGRTAEGEYLKLDRIENFDLTGDTTIMYSPQDAWENIEFIRLESPESPLTLCWRGLGLIGYIPGRTPPVNAETLCQDAPDIIYHNAVIVTMDPAKPMAEAVAINADKILATESDSDVLASRIPGCLTTLVDLGGLTILPGFNDNHNHVFSWPQLICAPTGDTSYPSLESRTAQLAPLGWTSISAMAFGRPDDGSAEHQQNAMNLDLQGKLTFRLNGYYGSLFDINAFDVLADSGRYAGQKLTGRVRTPGVKLYIDHPLGSDDGAYTQDEVNQLVARAREDGWQLAAHAVNTGGIEKILTAYETALGTTSNASDRYRIEHAVKVSDDQLMRMRDKGIIASFQLLGPGDWPTQQSHIDHISNTHPEWQMRWREFVDSGVPSVGSTDFPFNNAPCDYSPFRVIYEGVTRKGYITRVLEDWELNQRLTIEQCIKLLTIDGAYATKEEELKGSITPGKWADMVIVSGNPLEVSVPEDLLDITVLMTMVGGQVEYCDDVAGISFCNQTDIFPADDASISASAYLPGETPDLAFDADNVTNWGAGDFAPQWILIDLQSEYKINGVDMITGQYPAGNTVHQLLGKREEISSAFQLLNEFSGFTADGQILQYIAPGSLDSLRFIKVLTTESPSWVSWKEIIIYRNTAFPAGVESGQKSSPYTVMVAPNPLDESSQLTYHIPDREFVQIDLFSATGSLIATLVKAEQEQGRYTIQLSKHLPDSAPGILFLVFRTENNTHLVKLTKGKPQN
jgi:predicted amidohydrolase YtcJ